MSYEFYLNQPRQVIVLTLKFEPYLAAVHDMSYPRRDY